MIQKFTVEGEVPFWQDDNKNCQEYKRENS